MITTNTINMTKYLVISKNSSTFALANEECLIIQHRGVEQLVARQAHNLEVACSSPASATKTPITPSVKAGFRCLRVKCPDSIRTHY